MYVYFTTLSPAPYSPLHLTRVEAVCVLNQQRVFEDQYNMRRDGALRALCMDPCDVKMYTYQKHKVWAYTPFNETRSVCGVRTVMSTYSTCQMKGTCITCAHFIHMSHTTACNSHANCCSCARVRVAALCLFRTSISLLSCKAARYFLRQLTIHSRACGMHFNLRTSFTRVFCTHFACSCMWIVCVLHAKHITCTCTCTLCPVHTHVCEPQFTVTV